MKSIIESISIEDIKNFSIILGCMSVAFGLMKAVVIPIRNKIKQKKEAEIQRVKNEKLKEEQQVKIEEQLTMLTTLLSEHIANEKVKTEAQLCILRDSITDKYYRYKNGIPTYTRESLVREYACYHAMNGNSYIDTIYPEMLEFEVIKE